MEETLYTAGEIARIAGVSLRTIRFYDEKGLLKPVSYSEAGYRYYNQESLAILQRILMLKYLGFSLQRIEEVMASRNMELQLSEQKELLIQKKRKLEEIISSIELMENSREKDKCGFLIRLLNLLTEDEKIQEQYRTADNLEKRIRLHDYSTSPLGWIEWVYERLELKAGERVLELGCGTGKMTRLLAQAGYDMIGVDYSEEMLQIAREAAWGERGPQNTDILYLLQDMREFELYGTVRAVVSVCDSLNYILKEEELLKVFRLVNNYLDPGGVFIFDLNTPYKYREILGENTICENREQGSFIWENFYEEEEQVNQYDLTLFIRDREHPGLYRKYEETHVQRGYEAGRIEELLQQAGMEFIAAYDAFTREPVKADSERIYVIAREKGK